MNTLADLKRAMQQGVRLRGISNPHRPDLNGRERVVVRVQTNAFVCRDATPHVLVIRTLRDADAACSCGQWSLVFPTFDSDKDQSIRGRMEENFATHQTSALRDIWTRYTTASMFRFDGSNIFDHRLRPHSPDYVRLEVL
jgi:hypothetical protein